MFLRLSRDNIRGLLLIAPVMTLIIGLLIIPLILVVITSFGSRSPDGNVIYGFSFDNYRRLLGITPTGFDPLYLEILLRSLWLALQTTVAVIVIGFPLAYFIARASPRYRNLFLFLVLVPLWTNFVIRIYAWLMILRNQGVLNSLLGWGASLLGLPFQPLDLYPSDGAVLVGMIYEFLPFMILPIYTSLEKIDDSLFEAAADLGADALRTFLRVTLPLAVPGMVAGTILVFVPVMGTFIVADILGGRQVILVGNLVQRQFLDARDAAFGSAAALILMALTLVVTIFYTRRFGFGEEIVSA
ncbi:MAG: ABC transporter permease [Anaerolineales bacterium]|nr:ABC transporter permease [Anaerolineales bacterium]